MSYQQNHNNPYSPTAPSMPTHQPYYAQEGYPPPPQHQQPLQFTPFNGYNSVGFQQPQPMIHQPQPQLGFTGYPPQQPGYPPQQQFQPPQQPGYPPQKQFIHPQQPQVCPMPPQVYPNYNNYPHLQPQQTYPQYAPQAPAQSYPLVDTVAAQKYAQSTLSAPQNPSSSQQQGAYRPY